VLAWKVILGDQGVINTFLFWTGLRVGGAPDLPAALQQVRRHARARLRLAPFVALPIFVSLESLDRRSSRHASDLGASRLQAFRRVTLPLSLPGIVAAFLFVFIRHSASCARRRSSGTSGYMYGNQIVDLFGTGFPDWRPARARDLPLGVVTVLTVVFARFLQPRQVRQADGRRALAEGKDRAAGAVRARRPLPLSPDVILLIFSFTTLRCRLSR